MTKIYIHKDQLKPEPKPLPPEDAPVPAPKTSDTSFGEMLERCRLILEREIKALTSESSTGKLSKESSQSLRDYVKLLKELSDKERDLVQEMTEEQLKAVTNETKQTASG